MNRVEARLARERRTISVMIGMYCRAHHQPVSGLCPACAELEAYALLRIEKCPFGWRKPTCAKCPIHCYKPEMRERVRQVMRYAGPRMLLRHPLLAALHLLDGWRAPPQRP
jgi:hypothetical protein